MALSCRRLAFRQIPLCWLSPDFDQLTGLIDFANLRRFGHFGNLLTKRGDLPALSSVARARGIGLVEVPVHLSSVRRPVLHEELVTDGRKQNSIKGTFPMTFNDIDDDEWESVELTQSMSAGQSPWPSGGQ